MLEIQDVEILDKSKLNIVRKRSKKTQILLYDTKRRVDNFILKLKHRKNGKYEDIPHFIITKMGVVYQLFDTKYSSNTFNDSNVDKKQIKIAMENLGWLNKNTITGFLNNWIGDPYRTDPHIRNWRNHYFGISTPKNKNLHLLTYVQYYVTNITSLTIRYHRRVISKT
jgi:hypothetical protein